MTRPSDLPVRHRAERHRVDERKTGFGSWLREIAVILVSAMVLSLVIKTFLVQAFYIPSESMEQTLLKGDRVLVTKLAPGPLSLHRGDVVVFKDPDHWLRPEPKKPMSPLQESVNNALTFLGILPQDSGEHLIKRIIGMPGDMVKCCDAQGRLSVNGVSIDEPYLNPGARPSQIPFSVTVPENRLWVMGDNRQNSEDSRFHVDKEGGGAIPIDSVVGVAFVRLWPLDRLGVFRNPGDTFRKVPTK